MDIGEAAAIVGAIGRADMALVRATREAHLWELAEAWDQDRELTGLRDGTMKEYRLSIEIFCRFGIRRVFEVTPLAVHDFMRALVRGGRTAETANRKLAALSSLFYWLYETRRVPLAQLLELRELYFERDHVPPIRFLSPAEYVSLRALARTIDERFELLVAFGVEAGLRWHEARQLWREDLELEVEKPYLRVSHEHGRRNKTDKERTVPIRVAFAEELRARALPAGPIFPARVRRGETLRSPYIHRRTYRAWRKASLERGPRWVWHELRHTFGSYCAQSSRTLLEISEWLGCGEGIARKHYARLMPGGSKLIEDAFAKVPAFSARSPAA